MYFFLLNQKIGSCKWHHSNHIQNPYNRQQTNKRDIFLGKRRLFQNLERIIPPMHARHLNPNHLSILHGIPIIKEPHLHRYKPLRHSNNKNKLNTIITIAFVYNSWNYKKTKLLSMCSNVD